MSKPLEVGSSNVTVPRLDPTDRTDDAICIVSDELLPGQERVVPESRERFRRARRHRLAEDRPSSRRSRATSPRVALKAVLVEVLGADHDKPQTKLTLNMGALINALGAGPIPQLSLCQSRPPG
jgi:hypothetical protein